MSSEVPQTPDDPEFAASIEDVDVSDEMEQSYLDYAMSVIAGRALPDARDGLKPVQRRILYAMDEEGITSNSGHRKSSSIVGETMGNFHPHGDSAIYDTLVRMAQDYSLRYPLVDGQGNFGSMDGDPPAAQRYTEARMAPISSSLLTDLTEETVEWQSTYDDRMEEPTVLPTQFPNLLVNGGSGIAVGMSTKIPPHNLSEIVEATIHLIDNPDATIEDLMEYVKGPDFPTGANILGKDEIYKAYKTGRGKIRLRAEVSMEEYGNNRERIIITELPYEANKARLIKKIADDVKDGKVEGISDIRDESDRDGMRIVVEVKKRAMGEVVKNQLIDAHLESTFGTINLALVDGQPRVLNLQEMLQVYIDHRKDVVRRRTQQNLEEAEYDAHILEGRLKALDNVDDVVETIQNSEDRSDARGALKETFDFSDDQAKHIVAMQLGSLTSMESAEIQDEYDELQDTIDYLKTILNNESELLTVIKNELRDVDEKYGDERRTKIIEGAGTVTKADLIADEEVLVVLSNDDYIKRMQASQFDTQNRGGKGIIGTDLKDEDSVATVFRARTHDDLLVFTNHGEVYELKAYQVPEFGRTARGKSAANLLPLDKGENIESVVNADEFAQDEYLAMVTRGGYIKRTSVSEFQNILSTGIRSIKLEDDDELVDVHISDGNKDFLVSTTQGMSIRFDENEVRAMGRTARGVNAIRLSDGDEVAGMATMDEDDDRSLLTITKNGYGKRTLLTNYRKQSRNGKGLIDIKTEGRNGPVTTVKTVHDDDDIVIMSSDGQIMRTRVSEVSVVGRNTKGVRMMQLGDADSVASVDVIPANVEAESAGESEAEQ